MGALAHGLPMVLLPMGADQPHNADRCVALGVALALDAVTATPHSIQTAVATILSDTTYQQKAARLRDEIATLPAPMAALRLLEGLVVATHQ